MPLRWQSKAILKLEKKGKESERDGEAGRQTEKIRRVKM